MIISACLVVAVYLIQPKVLLRKALLEERLEFFFLNNQSYMQCLCRNDFQWKFTSRVIALIKWKPYRDIIVCNNKFEICGFLLAFHSLSYLTYSFKYQIVDDELHVICCLLQKVTQIISIVAVVNYIQLPSFIALIDVFAKQRECYRKYFTPIKINTYLHWHKQEKCSYGDSYYY